MSKFNSLFQLTQEIKTEAEAIEYLYNIRWGKGFYCPHCGSTESPYRMKKLGLFRCRACTKYLTVKVGTLFEDSKLPLQKWFYAIYLLNLHKKGISSCQLAKDLKITQKSAWYILQKLRSAMLITQTGITNNLGKNGNDVAIDETYLGGKEGNMHADKKPQVQNTTKRAVLGMVEKGGRLFLHALDKANKQNINQIIACQVFGDAVVVTDESQLYNPISLAGRAHVKVNHSMKQYVNEKKTTNTIEGVFSLLKRQITGIYHHVSKKHLNRYAYAFTFNYNNRSKKLDEQFNDCLAACCKVENMEYKGVIKK